MLLVWGYISSRTEILLQNWGRHLVPGEAYFGEAIWFLAGFLFHVEHLGDWNRSAFATLFAYGSKEIRHTYPILTLPFPFPSWKLAGDVKLAISVSRRVYAGVLLSLQTSLSRYAVPFGIFAEGG